MADSKCAACRWRARYDNDSRSFLGRLWRWHAGWCPGWKAHMLTLSGEERVRLAHQYRLPKYLKIAGSRP